MSGGGGAAAGGAISMLGALQEGTDVNSAYSDRADQLERAARVTRQNAEYNAQRLVMMAGKKIGAMKTDYAASGVSSDSGSVLDIIASSHANAELDRLNIIHEGDMKAMGLESQAASDRHSGHRAIEMGYVNAFGAAFGAGSKVQQMSGPGKKEKTYDPALARSTHGNPSRRNFDDEVME